MKVITIASRLALPRVRVLARSVATWHETGSFAAVITVCDDAAENCPVWLGEGKRVHIGFPDPALATGSEDERLAVFRQVRDDIRRTLIDYLDRWPG